MGPSPLRAAARIGCPLIVPGEVGADSEPDAFALLKACNPKRPEPWLEAESVAYILSAELGLDSSDYTFGYVATWAGGGDEAIAGISAAGERIQGAARPILSQLQEDAGNGGITSAEGA